MATEKEESDENSESEAKATIDAVVDGDAEVSDMVFTEDTEEEDSDE